MSGKAVQAVDSLAGSAGYETQAGTEGKRKVTVAAKPDPSGAKMHATMWKGKRSIKVGEVPKPAVTDPADVLLRITETAICGSDLHLYLHSMPGMKDGDVLGHEFMGIVEDVGPEVTKVRKGDRVVVAFDIGCNSCFYCKKQLYSSCASTNPSKAQEAMYGHPTGGFFGYSHLTGGYQGGQAEWVRVPFGDLNCLKVPPTLRDDQVLFLSDILPTAWHGCELGEVHEGDNVAIWGAGPVGQLTAQCAHYRGAKRVLLLDPVGYRLEHAKKTMPYVETIDVSKHDAYKTLNELVGQDGVDVAIEDVGLHYASSLVHKVEMAMQLETDTSEIINEMIYCVRKGGRLSIIGAYAGYCNHFNIGAFMEKQLTMRGGQTPCQKYWPVLLPLVEEGKLDPTLIITHKLPLADAAKGYKIFNDKEDNVIKVVLMTPAAERGDVGFAAEPAGAPGATKAS